MKTLVMVNSVVVTAFFNLSELKDTTKGTRTRDFYIKNGRGTVHVPYPMIIFCDAETKPMIQTIREEKTDAPTVYIEKNIAEYDHYKLNWPLVKENRDRSRYYKDGGRNTSSYFLTTSFKFLALRIAEERNDFQASHFFWIDFGIQHVVGETMGAKVKEILDKPHPKIGSMYINYRSREDLKNMEAICNLGHCGMAGGFFSVEKPYVRKLYTHAMAVLYQQMSRGVGHADEQIFTYCYENCPDMFTLFYGDYKSLLSNYHEITQDWWLINECFVKKTINAGRRDLAENCVKKALESKTLQLGEDDKDRLAQILDDVGR